MPIGFIVLLAVGLCFKSSSITTAHYIFIFFLLNLIFQFPLFNRPFFFPSSSFFLSHLFLQILCFMMHVLFVDLSLLTSFPFCFIQLSCLSSQACLNVPQECWPLVGCVLAQCLDWKHDHQREVPCPISTPKTTRAWEKEGEKWRESPFPIHEQCSWIDHRLVHYEDMGPLFRWHTCPHDSDSLSGWRYFLLLFVLCNHLIVTCRLYWVLEIFTSLPPYSCCCPTFFSSSTPHVSFHLPRLLLYRPSLTRTEMIASMHL